MNAIKIVQRVRDALCRAEQKKDEDIMMRAINTITRRQVIETAATLASVSFLVEPGQAAPAEAVKPFYVAPEEVRPYKPIQARGSDSTLIAVQEWGNPQGPEIVFVHGVLQSHLCFERQIRSELAREFRIVTYDLRGHGDSEKPMGSEHYLDGALWADDLAAVIAATNLRRPVIVGWSLGGLPIGNYLAKYGDDKLAGVNLVDALTKRSRDFAGRPENRALLARAASSDLGTRIEAVRSFLRACFKQQPSEDEFERMLVYNAQVPQHVLASIIIGVSLNADDAYRKVKVPVLVTHGEEDGQISVKIAEFDKSLMPHAELSIYEGCGHSPFFEMAPRFNRELAEFVRHCQ